MALRAGEFVSKWSIDTSDFLKSIKAIDAGILNTTNQIKKMSSDLNRANSKMGQSLSNIESSSKNTEKAVGSLAKKTTVYFSAASLAYKATGKLAQSLGEAIKYSLQYSEQLQFFSGDFC